MLTVDFKMMICLLRRRLLLYTILPLSQNAIGLKYTLRRDKANRLHFSKSNNETSSSNNSSLLCDAEENNMECVCVENCFLVPFHLRHLNRKVSVLNNTLSVT